MVDPRLAQRSGAGSSSTPVTGRDGARMSVPAGGLLEAPAPTPATDVGKLTLGELARVQSARRPAPKDCDKNFRYSAVWAAKLPADIPLYPDAQVSEAAGNDSPGCRIRIVSFTTAAPLKGVIDWYYTRAIRSGFSSEHQLAADGDHILAGARQRDDAAYYVLARKQGSGTEIDLIASAGR